MPIFPEQEKSPNFTTSMCVYIYVTFLSMIIGHSEYVRERERGAAGVVGIRERAYVKICNHWRNTN
jgi:hypothetical protein